MAVPGLASGIAMVKGPIQSACVAQALALLAPPAWAPAAATGAFGLMHVNANACFDPLAAAESPSRSH